LMPDPYYCENFLFCKNRPQPPSDVSNGTGQGKQNEAVNKVALHMYSCPPGKLFHIQCGDCRKVGEVDCGPRHRDRNSFGDNPYLEAIPPDLKCERSWRLREDGTILFQDASPETTNSTENPTTEMTPDSSSSSAANMLIENTEQDLKGNVETGLRFYHYH